MLQDSFYWASLFQKIAEFFLETAAGISLFAALGIMIGRRGHARFCIAGASFILKCGFFLSLITLFYYPFSCYLILAPHNPGWGWINVFFSRPGFSWLFAWGASIIACVCQLCAWQSSCHVKTSLHADQYDFALIKRPVALALCSSLFFFLAFFLINWPFGGYPPELSTGRILVAVLRTAFRQWFASLSVAAGFSLVIAPFYLGRASWTQHEKENSLKWCALCALGAALPAGLQNLGIFIGILAKGKNFLTATPGAFTQLAAIILSILAILAWGWCLWKKKSGMMAWLALVFLFLRNCIPFLGSFLNNLYRL